MANVYGKRTKAEEKFTEGGYRNQIWFAPVNTFTSIKTPTDTPSAVGDKVKITTAHTFGASDGFIPWRMKKHSVTTTYETVGEDGSKSLMHKGKATLIGDDAATLEQLRDLLNDDVIIMTRDQDCVAGEYVQFGDACLTPDISLAGDMKTTKEGLKEQTIEWSVKDKKFFYLSTISEKP